MYIYIYSYIHICIYIYVYIYTVQSTIVKFCGLHSPACTCLCTTYYIKGKGIWFIALYPPKRSHDLPPLAGLYTRKPFQSPGGYSRATGII